jgi:hypothetical protein
MIGCCPSVDEQLSAYELSHLNAFLSETISQSWRTSVYLKAECLTLPSAATQYKDNLFPQGMFDALRIRHALFVYQILVSNYNKYESENRNPCKTLLEIAHTF